MKGVAASIFDAAVAILDDGRATPKTVGNERRRPF
jgi:hypothetical protein